MNTNTQGLIFAILSPIFSSIATIFKSGAAKELTPLVVIVIGGLLGSIILFSIGKLLQKKISFKKIKNNLNDLSFVLILRFLLGEIFLTVGLSQTQAVKAIFLTKIEPYFVLILAWIFLKEKVRFIHLILLFVHLLGAVLLSTGGEFDVLKNAHFGDLFIIISMGLFAASYHYSKKLAHNIGSIQSNAISYGVASILFLPVMLFLSPFYEISFSSKGWVYLIAFVLFFNVIGLTLWFASLKTVKGWIVSALRYIGPIIGAPVAYILFGETLNTVQITGASIIIITSFFIVREHFRSIKNI